MYAFDIYCKFVLVNFGFSDLLSLGHTISIIGTYLYTMSEPEERPYAGVEEEQREEGLQQQAEARTEEDKGVEVIGSVVEEEQARVLKGKQGEEKVNQPKTRLDLLFYYRRKNGSQKADRI